MKNHTSKLLTMDVMRPADGSDCSMKGLSSRVVRAQILAELTQDESYQPAVLAQLKELSSVELCSGCGAFVLITRPGTIYGSFLAPLQEVIDRKWTMFGGNLAHTSNGVVTAITKERVLSIHDRVES